VKWSWQAGTVAGIRVRVHSTFLILVAWFALSYWQATGSVAAVVYGVVFILALFGCVLLHELGHALTAARFGVRTRSITLLPIGGIAAVEKMPENPRLEIVIALAGPAVNLVIALLLWLYLEASGGLVPWEELGLVTGAFWQRLMLVNVLLAGFNLLPAFPMDGGRVFRATLALSMDRLRATRVAAGVGQGVALFMALMGLMYNPFLLLIAIFVWIGAAAESSTEIMKSRLSGLTAKEAMLSNFQTLEPHDTLARAVELTLAGSQKDFPVVTGGHMVGFLTQAHMLRALQQDGEQLPVERVMQAEVLEVPSNEVLERVLEHMQKRSMPMAGIVDKGRLVGIVNHDNLVELLRILAAREGKAD
jgi:Zn-dependent protease